MCQGRNVIIIIILFFYCCCCSNVARYIKREFPQPVNEPISLFFSDSNFIPEHSSEMFKVIFSLFLILTGISSGNSLQKNWFFFLPADSTEHYRDMASSVNGQFDWTLIGSNDVGHEYVNLVHDGIFPPSFTDVWKFTWKDIPRNVRWQLSNLLGNEWETNYWAQPSGQSPSLETDDARRRNNLLTNYSIQEIITVIQLSTRLALPPPLRIASRTPDVRPTLSSIVIATCIAL